MAFCSSCGTQIADGSTICPACASRAPVPVVTQSSASGLTDNVAGMLAYVTIVPAIVFLVLEPYNRKKFIRFHSFQSIFFFVALLALHFALTILTFMPMMALITLPLHLVVSLGGFVLWIILLIKANQGQMYKLPVIGDLAEKQANA